MKKQVLLCTIMVLSIVAQEYDKAMYEMSRTMANVFATVQKKHYKVSNPQEHIFKALKSFMNSLDAHSSFLDPSAYKQIIETTQGEFYGIGVAVDNLKQPDQEFLRILEVIPDGPASKSDIQPDDKIVEIDGKTIKGLSTEEIVPLLKGKKNTTVALKILRKNHPELITIKIKRDKVNQQNAYCYHFNENNIYYVSLNMFTENSVKQITQLLQKCKDKKAKGIIFDLRNNTERLLNVTLDIAGLFLDKNSLVVTTKNKDKKILESFKTSREPLALPQIPIFILTNNYTASASEILAGCLQAHSQAGKQKHNNLRVFLIGSKTFGKGSVQEVIPVNNDCAIKITTALYYLPNDVCIQNIGITPDFEICQRIKPSKDTNWFVENFGRESSLKNSIKNSSSQEKDKEAKEKTWQEKRQEAIGSDYIILSAARMIDMYAMMQKAFPKEMATASRIQIAKLLRQEYIPDEQISMKEIKI